MKKSLICYNLAGLTIFIGTFLFVFGCTDFITSCTTAGLTYAFVRLFDSMGDDHRHEEKRADRLR
jgi:hypothetical protein